MAGSATTSFCCGGGGAAGGGSGAAGGYNGGSGGGAGGAGGILGFPNSQPAGDGGNGNDGGGGGGGYNGGTYIGFFSGVNGLTGGNGGNGGNGNGLNGNAGSGGGGGDGGAGIQFTASGATFTNTGTVTGGNGGQAGAAGAGGGSAGSAGAGGVGITGAGLTVINSGTITGGTANGGNGAQANAITFTGGSNTLELRAGSVISGNVVDQTNGGTLALGGTASATFALGTLTQYTGFSTYSKTGTGTWTLTGTGSTGNTGWSVNQGTLEVDGALTSGTITVNSGGTLSGSGTITDPVISSGATLAPGTAGSIGTLTINGPLTFNAGSFYNVRVTSAGANDFTQVNGATTINGGTVSVTAGNGTYQASTRYTILTATGGVTGTFTGVTSNLAFLTPSLSYDASDVYLTLAPVLLAAPNSGNTPSSPNYRTAAASGNQYALASALTNAGTGNPNAPILAALNQLTTAQAQAAFNALSGEGIAAAKTAGIQMTSLFSEVINDQSTLWLDGGHTGNEMVLTEQPTGALGYAPSAKMKTPIVVHDPVLAPVRTWRAWASGFGGDETVHGDAGAGSAAQSSSYYGGAMGVDYQINPDLLIGIAGSGSSGSFSVSGRSTYGSVTGGGLGAYGVATFGSFYAASSTSLGFFHNSETRSIAGFGGLGFETDHGSFDSIAVRTRVEAGRRFADVYGAAVTPFVALEIANLHSNGFNEAPTQGTGVFALNTQGGDTASVPLYLGVRLERLYGLGNGMSVRPILSLAYGHDFAAQSQISNTLLGLSGNPFGISGAQIARDFAQTKAGFELAFAPNAVAFVNFDGQFSNRDQLYGGKGGVKFTW